MSTVTGKTGIKSNAGSVARVVIPFDGRFPRISESKSAYGFSVGFEKAIPSSS